MFTCLYFNIHQKPNLWILSIFCLLYGNTYQNNRTIQNMYKCHCIWWNIMCWKFRHFICIFDIFAIFSRSGAWHAAERFISDITSKAAFHSRIYIFPRTLHLINFSLWNNLCDKMITSSLNQWGKIDDFKIDVEKIKAKVYKNWDEIFVTYI